MRQVHACAAQARQLPNGFTHACDSVKESKQTRRPADMTCSTWFHLLPQRTCSSMSDCFTLRRLFHLEERADRDGNT